MRIAITMVACGFMVLGAMYLLDQNRNLTVMVYKGPSCDCCEVWMDYMRENGFTVKTPEDPDDDGMEYRLKIPSMLASCHTAVIAGYIVEGHVPVSDINRLLDERPDFVGIAVPDMPIGSPGMDGPNPEMYKTFTFDSNPHITVYATHNP